MRALPVVVLASLLVLVPGCNCGGDTGPGALGPLQAAIGDGTGALMLLELDGGASLLLDNGVVAQSGVDDPRWDPTGTKLAFTAGSYAFVLEDLGRGAAGVRQLLLRGTDPYYRGAARVEWSSDGRWLALFGDATDESSGVFVVPLDGGVPAYRQTLGAWAFEPGGSGVLFDHDTGEGSEVWRLDPATDQAHRVMAGRLLDASARGVAEQQCRDPGDGGFECAVTLHRPDGGTALLVPGGPYRVSERSNTTLTLSPSAEEAAVELMDEATGAARLLWVRAGGAWTVVAEVDADEAFAAGELPEETRARITRPGGGAPPGARRGRGPGSPT